MRKLLVLGALVGLAFGCSSADDSTTEAADNQDQVQGGKFDTPAGKLPPEEFCHMRRAEALTGLRLSPRQMRLKHHL